MAGWLRVTCTELCTERGAEGWNHCRLGCKAGSGHSASGMVRTNPWAPKKLPMLLVVPRILEGITPKPPPQRSHYTTQSLTIPFKQRLAQLSARKPLLGVMFKEESHGCAFFGPSSHNGWGFLWPGFFHEEEADPDEACRGFLVARLGALDAPLDLRLASAARVGPEALAALGTYRPAPKERERCRSGRLGG